MRFNKIILCILCSFFMVNLIPLKTDATINVSAEKAILIDQSSGRILYKKNHEDQTLIASITKIMTAIIAIESGKLHEKTTISSNAIKTEGSSIYLKENDRLSIQDLTYGLMLRSGNDAAIAIAEHIGGSEEGFVLLMNEKAEWLGMDDTSFANPHGLDEENHFSSAYDMALLTQYAMKNDIFKKIFSTKTYKSQSIEYPWINKNKLLTRLYESSTGGKTGYTKAAGRTLISTAEKNGQSLIAVTINAPDDWNDHIYLFEWGFTNYKKQKIPEKNKFRIHIRESNEVIEGEIKDSLLVPLTENESENISTKIILSPHYKDKQIIGTKKFYIDEEFIAKLPIYKISEKKERKSFFELFNTTIDLFLGDQNG